jgi:DNA cross-link repair 1A protein
VRTTKRTTIKTESTDGNVVVIGDEEDDDLVEILVPTASSSTPSRIGTPSSSSSGSQRLPKSSARKNPKASPRQKPMAPFYKTITFNLSTGSNFRVTVDGFNYAYEYQIDHHFLSHFHSDHYIGMTKKWFMQNQDHSRVYCSEISKRLMVEKFNLVEESHVDMISTIYNEWNTLFESRENDEFVKVMALDANHCPGGLIFIFRHYVIRDDVEIVKKVVLHTGDFRVSKKMIEKLRAFQKIDEIYLDTTYLNPIYLFIEQNSLVKKTGIYLKKKFGDAAGQKGKNSILNYFSSDKSNGRNSWVLLIGTYSIGKENLYLKLSEYLDTKILIPFEKFKVLKNFIPEYVLSEKFVIFDNNLKKFKDGNTSYKIDGTFNIFSLDHINSSKEFNCLIHLLPIGKLSDKLFLNKYYHNKKIIKIKPTGWCFRQFTRSMPKPHEYSNDDSKVKFLHNILHNDEKFDNFDEILGGMLKFKNEVYLPYSEHSNFKELSLFCSYLNWDRIIPTVSNHYQKDIKSSRGKTNDNEFEKWFETWKNFKVEWSSIEAYYADED